MSGLASELFPSTGVFEFVKGWMELWTKSDQVHYTLQNEAHSPFWRFLLQNQDVSNWIFDNTVSKVLGPYSRFLMGQILELVGSKLFTTVLSNLKFIPSSCFSFLGNLECGAFWNKCFWMLSGRIISLTSHWLWLIISHFSQNGQVLVEDSHLHIWYSF